MIVRYPTKTRVIVNVLAVSTAVALCISSWALYDRFQQSRQTQHATIGVVRTVLCLARSAVVVDRTAPRQSRDRAVDFYDKALETIHAQPCNIPKGATR